MNSESYADACPNCGNYMECSRGSNPLDTAGDCIYCGYSYIVVVTQMTLHDINTLRKDFNNELHDIPLLNGEARPRKFRMLTRLPYMKKSLLA